MGENIQDGLSLGVKAILPKDLDIHTADCGQLEG